MKYEDRVVVFLDILDFSNIIKNSTNKESKFKAPDLCKVFEDIAKIMDINGKHWYISRQGTHFSDSVVISYKAHDIANIIGSLVDIQFLIARLINYGILVRGALSKGNCIHNNKMLFGPALVEAYEMETKAAIYPRVVLEKDLVHHLLLPELSKRNVERNKFRLIDIISKDQDGLYFINYFFNVGYLSIEHDYKKYTCYNYVEYLTKIRGIIENSLEHKSPGVRIKYQWMREKYNQLIDNLKIPSDRMYKRHKNSIKDVLTPDEFKKIMHLKKIN